MLEYIGIYGGEYIGIYGGLVMRSWAIRLVD